MIKKLLLLGSVLLMMSTLLGCQSINKDDILDMFKNFDEDDYYVEELEELYQYKIDGEFYVVNAKDDSINVGNFSESGIIMLYLDFEEDRGDILIYEVYLEFIDIDNGKIIELEGSFDRFYEFEDISVEDFIKVLSQISFEDMQLILDELGIDETKE